MTQPAIKPPTRLTLVKRGKVAAPLRVLMYSAEGVGKSTFAAGSPSPIFISAENGTNELDIARYVPETFADVLQFIDELLKESHEYKTIVVDPLNHVEPMVFAQVVGTSGKSIEDYSGGYGKGYAAALDQWRILVSGLERLWTRGMNIVLLAHSSVKAFNDPEGPSYDRYEPALNAKAAGLMKQWVDFVLFARNESFSKVDATTKKAKGFSTGKRVIHSVWTAAYDAKSRVRLPEELPLSWADFASAVENGRADVEGLKREIAALVEAIGDADVAKKATALVASSKDDVGVLAGILNGLNIRAKEQAT